MDRKSHLSCACTSNSSCTESPRLSRLAVAASVVVLWLSFDDCPKSLFVIFRLGSDTVENMVYCLIRRLAFHTTNIECFLNVVRMFPSSHPMIDGNRRRRGFRLGTTADGKHLMSSGERRIDVVALRPPEAPPTTNTTFVPPHSEGS